MKQKQKQDWIQKRTLLRTEAESLVTPISQPGTEAQPVQELMHELLVHKVELEMQNEELRRAYSELEEARDRYLDLYEFAPIGYLTISREGLMSEINLRGAELLGVDRTKLASRRFSQMVAPQDMDRWHRLFMHIMEHADGGKLAFELQMLRADGSTFDAHLDCLRRESPNAPPVLRVAMVDISSLKLAERDAEA
ncbi:MAG: histidine kinase [Betaproteobacteria bacterium HGW-Betaproteobacteria-1]|jgi:PAS domain S-box-containing protein|nr:MAG: histidine kinase [Betaproteobacteria bacterium HGW-Betaproteobacteria-1]